MASARPSVPAPLLHRTPFRGRFLPGHPLIWIEDAQTEALAPYWLPRAWVADAEALIAGTLAPASLAPDRRAALRAIGLLEAPGALSAARTAFTDKVADARGALTSCGYTSLSGLVSRAQREALSAHLRR